MGLVDMTTRYKKEIHRLAKAFGIKLSPRRSHDSWEWDGKTIATNSWKRPHGDIIHDIAHWIVADEDRRCLPDFGIGEGVNSGKPAGIIIANPDDEESVASVLGILIERQLGMPSWRYTYKYHSWNTWPPTEFLKWKNIVRAHGLTGPGGRLIFPS